MSIDSITEFNGYNHRDDACVFLFSKNQRCFHSEPLSYFLKEMWESWMECGDNGFNKDFLFVSITYGNDDYAKQCEYWQNVFYLKGMVDRPYEIYCKLCDEYDGTYRVEGQNVICSHCERVFYRMPDFYTPRLIHYGK